MAEMTYGNYSFDPVPLISYQRERVRDSDNNKLFDRITLNCNGAIVDAGGTFGSIDKDNFAHLASGLNEDYRELVIVHDSGTFTSGVFPRVEGFSTEESVWVNLLRYSFSFIYDDLPAGSGFVDLYSDSWDWAEEDDDTVTVSHTIQAKGINTNPTGSSNSLTNARDFVRTRQGVGRIPTGLPERVYSLYNDKSYVERLVSEAANPSDGNYSVTENFVFASGLSNNYIHRNNVDLSKDINGIYNVTIQGNIQGGGTTAFDRKNKALEGWNAVKPDVFATASGVYNLLGGPRTLSSSIISESISKNDNAGLITYSRQYSDKLNINSDSIIDADWGVSDNKPLRQYATIEVPGKIDGPVIQDLATTTQGTFNVSGSVVGVTIEDAISYAQDIINQYGGQSKGTTRRITENKFDPNYQSNTVSFSITWTYSGDEANSTVG